MHFSNKVSRLKSPVSLEAPVSPDPTKSNRKQESSDSCSLRSFYGKAICRYCTLVYLNDRWYSKFQSSSCNKMKVDKYNDFTLFANLVMEAQIHGQTIKRGQNSTTQGGVAGPNVPKMLALPKNHFSPKSDNFPPEKCAFILILIVI